MFNKTPTSLNFPKFLFKPLFQKKEKDINWKWIKKQYKKLGQFRLRPSVVNKNRYNIDKKIFFKYNTIIWSNEITTKEYCLNLIYRERHRNMMFLKKQKGKNFIYIPPRTK